MINNKPLVSIIIPVFNVENYLEECLNSVLSQTFSRLEVIAVDDGSSDNSPNILKDFSLNFPQLKVFLEKQNKGQSAARNIGIENAKGKYLLFVDSDDYIAKDTVSELVKVMEKRDVDVVRFNATSFSEESQHMAITKYKFDHFLKDNIVYRKPNFKNVYLSYSPSPVLYLVKKSLLNLNNIRFVESIIHEDEWFTTMIFLHANNCAYINQSFYHRRYRAGSTMTISSINHKKHSFKSYITIIRGYQKILEETKLSKEDVFFLKTRINSIFLPLRNFELPKDIKEKELAKITTDKIYYTQLYKNYTRLLKLTIILKNKLSN